MVGEVSNADPALGAGNCIGFHTNPKKSGRGVVASGEQCQVRWERSKVYMLVGVASGQHPECLLLRDH